MSSNMYSDMVEKISSLEAKIQCLERVCAGGGDENNFKLCKNDKCFESARYLVNLTRNLKQDIIQKPCRYDSDEKILSQMYNKVCVLETELGNLIQPKHVEKQSFTPYINCNRPPKQFGAQCSTGTCVPYEAYFDKVSIQSTKSLQEVVSTSSTDELIYYDISQSSSTFSSTTLIVEEIEPTEQQKVVYSSDSEILPVYVKKSRRKPKHRHNKKVNFETSTNKQIKELSKSPVHKKQQNCENHISHKKSTKQQHRFRRKSISPKLYMSKSKLPDIPKQETEIFFVKKQKPIFEDLGSINNNLHKDKYLITRLKRVNTPKIKEFHYTNKSQNVNPSQPIRSRDFEIKPPRNKSSRYRGGGNVINDSDYSIESQYIKAKWKRGPQAKNEKMKSKIYYTSSPVNRDSDPSSHKNPTQYVYSAVIPRNNMNFVRNRANGKIYSPKGCNNNHRKTQEKFGNSKSNDEVTCLTSSNMSFSNSNYEIVSSFFNTVPEKTQTILVSRSQGGNSQKSPITVYSLTDETPKKGVRFHHLHSDDVILINGGKSKLISVSKTNVPKKQLNNSQFITQHSHSSQNGNKSLNRVSKKNNNFSKNEGRENQVLLGYNEISTLHNQNKNTISNPVAHSVYVTTIPVFQEDSQKSPFGLTTQQINGPDLPEANTYTGTLSEDQIEMVANKLSPVLTKAFVSSMNSSSEKRSNIEPFPELDHSNQVQTGNLTSLDDNENIAENHPTIDNIQTHSLDRKINSTSSRKMSRKTTVDNAQLPQLKNKSRFSLGSRKSLADQNMNCELVKSSSKKRSSTINKSDRSQSNIESNESKLASNKKPSVSSMKRFFHRKTISEDINLAKEQDNRQKVKLSTIPSISEGTDITQHIKRNKTISFDKGEVDMTETKKHTSVTSSVKNNTLLSKKMSFENSQDNRKSFPKPGINEQMQHELTSQTSLENGQGLKRQSSPKTSLLASRKNTFDHIVNDHSNIIPSEKSLDSRRKFTRSGSQGINKLIQHELTRQSTAGDSENIHGGFKPRSVSEVIGEVRDSDSNIGIFNNFLGESSIGLTRPFSIKEKSRPSTKSAVINGRMSVQKPNISTEENKNNSLKNSQGFKRQSSTKTSLLASRKNTFNHKVAPNIILSEKSPDSKRKSTKPGSQGINKLMQHELTRQSTVGDSENIHGAFKPRSVSEVIGEVRDSDSNIGIFNNFLGESSIGLTRPFSIREKSRPSTKSAAIKGRISVQKPNSLGVSQDLKQQSYANIRPPASMKNLYHREVFPKNIVSEESLDSKKNIPRMPGLQGVHELIQNELIKQSTIDGIGVVHGARSISGVLGDFGDSDTTYSLFFRDFQDGNNRNKVTRNCSIKDCRSYSPPKSTTDRVSVKPFILNEECINNNISNDLDRKHLNYSIRLTKEKCRNVEMNSVSSTLSISDILPSNYRKLLSMEELTLSEHRLNGVDLHRRVHNLLVHPIDNIKRNGGNSYLFSPTHNSKTTNSLAHSEVLPNIAQPKYYKNIPIRTDNHLSDSTQSIDWRTVVHEIKEHQ